MSAEHNKVPGQDDKNVLDTIDEETYAKILAVISDRLDVPREKLTDDASFVADLNADSLSLVELIMALEDALKIEIDTHDGELITRVGHVRQYLNVRQNPALLEAWREKREAEIEAYNKQKQSA